MMRKKMPSAKYEKIISKLRVFHYSTDLPVSLLDGGKVVFIMPEDIKTGYSLLKDASLIPVPSNEETHPQIFKNYLYESALFINLGHDDFFAVIGPVLSAPMEPGTITNLVRKGLIPFHQQTTFQKYYKSLKIADDNKLFFSGVLLESLISSSGAEDADDFISEKTEKDGNDLYIQQKKSNRQNSFFHSPYSIEREICKTISSGDTENAKIILKEMNIAPHAKLAPNQLRSYKNSMICSCSFMTRAAIAGGVNPDNAFTLSDIYINKIENSTSMNELKNFESTMIEGFTQKVRDLKSQQYSPTVLNAIYYIDNHLCEDIKIKDIADEVYVNPSYLSGLFHKETGFTISDWILKNRIEEASHMVLNGKESFAEIALFYHFCSQSYFVQCFKKIMGTTPGEYRRKNKGQ